MTEIVDICRKANEHFEAGRFEEALKGYNLVLEDHPDQAPIHMNIGATLRGLGKLEEALAAFDKCLELDPKDAQAAYQRINLLNFQHRFADAITSAQKALELNDSELNLHLELVLAAINEHNVEILEAEIKVLEPKKDELDERGTKLYSLALFEVANQLSSDPSQRDRALELYNATIAIAPSASMYFNKAVCCMAMEKFDEAEVSVLCRLARRMCAVTRSLSLTPSLLSYIRRRLH